MALPSNVSRGIVSGRFISSSGEPYEGLTIRFKPDLKRTIVKVLTAVPKPVTINVEAEAASTDENGDVYGSNGEIGVPLIDPSDPDISPRGWTWNCTIEGPSFPPVEFSFPLTAAGVDLTTVLEVPPTIVADIAAWQAATAATLANVALAQAARADAETARDEAVEAAASVPTEAELSTTFGTVRGQRPGNYIAVLSDSTGRGVYTGDSEPGIFDGVLLTTAVSGDSWITWAQLLSEGRVTKGRNASVIGNTIAQMDARVIADVVNAPMRLSACIVGSGYNDAFNEVTPAAYMTSLRSIIGKLRAGGIVPIITTPLPTSNSATIGGLLVEYGIHIRQYAAEEGIFVLPFGQWAMDPETGGLRSEVGTGGDGVHPSAAGQKWLGQKVADALAPLLPPMPSALVVSPLDASNIAPNGMFTGSATDGIAPGVFISGAAQPGVTPSVVTDALVPGKMQRATHAGSTAPQVYAQRITRAGKWAHGDVLEVSGVVTAQGIPASVGIEWWEAPFGTLPINLTQDAERGYYSTRVTVPAVTGFPDSFDMTLTSGPGTGSADFGQLTIRNLTALGLA